MANHYYFISEAQFHRDKEEKNTRNFVEGTGIDLDSDCTSTMPCIKEIEAGLVNFGLETELLVVEDDRIEITTNGDLWFIFTGQTSPEEETNMFEIGRGSDHAFAKEFIRHLGRTHGKFLFYCDSGEMSLIEP